MGRSSPAHRAADRLTMQMPTPLPEQTTAAVACCCSRVGAGVEQRHRFGLARNKDERRTERTHLDPTLNSPLST